MALDYLHFQIFGLALKDMATSTGSISERVRGAFIGYFYKVSWDKDLEFIPDNYKRDFLQLKKVLHDDIIEAIEKQRKDLTTRNPEISDDLLNTICNPGNVIKSLHWRKAQKIAELISHIYFGLGMEIKNQLQEKARQRG